MARRRVRPPFFGRFHASGGGKRPQSRVLVAGALLAAVVVPAVRAVAPARAVAVTASVNGATAVLGNARVQRRWHITSGPTGGVATTALVDGSTGRSWAGPASTDFNLTVDGVASTSTGTWQVLEASARDLGPSAAQIVFRLATPVTSPLGLGIEVDRTYTLHAGSATIEVQSTLVNHTPAPYRHCRARRWFLALERQCRDRAAGGR